MKETFIKIKEVSLNNNCPECFNNSGLKLVFKQKFIETEFYKSITDSITHDITCENCNTTIYPVLWNDDIERVVEYQRKALTPKKTSTYLKKSAWTLGIIVAVVLLTVITIVVYSKL